MGWWKSEHGIIGDEPADILSRALDEIIMVYVRRCFRPPTQGELANLIEFNTNGRLLPSCGLIDEPFTRNTNDECTVARTPGHQGVFGPHAACKPGEMVNVDPQSMDHYEAGETEPVLENELREQEERGGQTYQTGG